LRYILEGIHHQVVEAESRAAVPGLLASDPPDLLILGVHLDALDADGGPGSAVPPDWSPALPDVPLLLLFSGPPGLREEFLSAWQGPKTFNVLDQPLEPYPLLAMVKSMVTAPEIWRRGGQHKV